MERLLTLGVERHNNAIAVLPNPGPPARGRTPPLMAPSLPPYVCAPSRQARLVAPCGWHARSAASIPGTVGVATHCERRASWCPSPEAGEARRIGATCRGRRHRGSTSTRFVCYHSYPRDELIEPLAYSRGWFWHIYGAALVSKSPAAAKLNLFVIRRPIWRLPRIQGTFL